jgi:hypothetical protein
MVDSPADAWRRRLLIAGAALPVSCASPTPGVAPPSAPPPLPEPRIGQRWRYETIDQFRGQAIGELRAEVIRNDPSPRLPAGRPRPAGHVAPLVVALTDSRGASMGEEQWAGAWDILLEPAYDTPQTFDSPMPLLPDRLEPGFRRTDTTWYRASASPDTLWWQQRLSAVRWERVSVPAGDFDALRIERFINFRHWDGWREHPWRTDTVWYAPTVGRWVQREWTGRYRWPGRRPVEASEDRVRWRLLDWQPGASRVSAPSR